jgi:pimeloyl-ACP methyl ester carboxylesterase
MSADAEKCRTVAFDFYGDRSLGEFTAHATINDNAVTFPAAQPPQRQRNVDSDGVRINVCEWGDADAPPLLLTHGGFDFIRTFDVFAPMLAKGGWRVVAWDQRCHGDSERSSMQSWSADLRDAYAVLASTTSRPIPIIGHSKGGNLVCRLASSVPHRFSHVINIDGLPSHRTAPDVNDHERSRMLRTELTGWLDHRHRASDSQRKPGTLEELAQRRAKMNTRLTHEWLCYLVTVGASLDSDGWRWKIDPMLRMGGFGPWRPEWAMADLPTLPMPFLSFLGLEHEAMGWGTKPGDVTPYLPEDGHLIAMEDTGHFVHIEQPGFVSDEILSFIGDPK